MTWMRLDLAQENVLANKVEVLQEEFMSAYTAAYAAAGAPIRTAGMFAHPASSIDGEHLYYTPSAVEFMRDRLEELGATPCEAPPRGDTALMAGEAGAWDVLAVN